MLTFLKTDESKDNHLTKTLPQVFGVSAAAIGFVALLGWILGLPLLATFGAGLIPMAPSTALLFVMFGVAVFFCNRMPQNRATYLTGMVIGAIGAVTALLLFFSSSARIYLQIEYLGLSISGAVDGAPIGHMSPVTALCFVVIALSFLATLSSSAGRPKRALAAFLLACLAVLTSSLLLLAYFYGTPLMYGGGFIPPALPTSLAFLVLALGLLATPGLQVWLDSGIKDAATARLSYVLGLIFVIVAAGIVTAGYLYYRNYQKQYRAQVEGQLSVVSELKVGELVQWRKERLANASILFKNVSVSALVRRFFEKPEDADARLQLRSWLDKFQAHIEYDRVFLLDTRGVIRMAAPVASEPIASTIILQRASEILRSSQIAFQDFYRDEHNQRVYLAVLVPILDETDASRPLGVLVLQIDPTTYLYPFIQRWPTPSRTSETLIIRRDGNDALFLSEIKFKTNSALNLRIPLERKDVVAVKAALGQEGAVEGIDYRGVPVIASVRAIPGSPWSLVAHMDVDEIYGPLREKLWVSVFLIGALLIGAGAGIALIWRQQHISFYRERYQATKALQVQYNELQTLREIGNIILTSSDLKSALARVLAEILPACSFDLGVVRLLDAKSQNLEPIASLGFNDLEDENKLRSAYLERGRDPTVDHVLTEKKVMVLENLREPGALRIMQREGIQSAILVPIKTEQQVLGILQVGNRTTRRFQPDKVHLLEGAGNLIGIGVQKAQLYEETHRNLERIRALREIDAAMTSTLDLHAVLEILLNKTRLFVPYICAATVKLVNPETGEVESVACFGFPEEEWKTTIRAPHHLTERVMEARAPIVARDIQTDPRNRNVEFERKYGLVSYMGVPLIVKDEVIGALGLFTDSDCQFSDE
jgi:GAF domain-containing protein